MSNKSNEPMREPIDDDAVSQEGDVWPPAPDGTTMTGLPLV